MATINENTQMGWNLALEVSSLISYFLQGILKKDEGTKIAQTLSYKSTFCSPLKFGTEINRSGSAAPLGKQIALICDLLKN